MKLCFALQLNKIILTFFMSPTFVYLITCMTVAQELLTNKNLPHTCVPRQGERFFWVISNRRLKKRPTKQNKTKKNQNHTKIQTFYYYFIPTALIGELCGVKAVQISLPRKKGMINSEKMVVWSDFEHVGKFQLKSVSFILWYPREAEIQILWLELHCLKPASHSALYILKHEGSTYQV